MSSLMLVYWLQLRRFFGLRIASPNIERAFTRVFSEWISFGSHLLKLERYRED